MKRKFTKHNLQKVTVTDENWKTEVALYLEDVSGATHLPAPLQVVI